MASNKVMFDKFDAQDEDIASYLDRLTQYFIALDIVDDEDNAAKRKAILLSSLGSETYTILRDVCFPQQPSEKTYSQLCDALKSHFEPKRLVVAERFRFNTTKQQPNQRIGDYVKYLKKMATFCEFTGTQLDEQLRDRFICGLESESLQKKLLSQNRSFKQAVEIALADEAAARNVHDISSSNTSENKKVNLINATRSYPSGFQGRRNFIFKKGCDRCGLDNHTRDDCKHKNAQCYNCQRRGHLQSQCTVPREQSENTFQTSRGKKSGQRPPRRSQNLRYVEEEDDNSDDELVRSIFTVTGTQASDKKQDGPSKPGKNVSALRAIKVPMVVEGNPIEMELDTGAAVSVMNRVDYEKHFKHIPLQSVARPLHSYAGTPLKIVGQINVNVKYQSQSAVLPLIIVEVDRYTPPLVGRSWLAAIRFDWPQLFSQGEYNVRGTSVEELKTKYAEIFTPELGTVKGVKATLHVKEGAVPVFHKARPVPYSLRPAVEKELTRMQEEGVITQVDFSEWATPLVLVPKTDGSIRLCGDYRSTVNQGIHVDTYPIPTPEEVHTKLAGGKTFSKIDLRCAYQQLLLDEESQALATISTHKGLFRYTRLPFGISSSPAIWQRFIDQVLLGLDSTCAIMDDVIVTGKDEEEHLQNLEKVFQRFQRYGLKVKVEKCSFMQTSVVYMGTCISAEGIHPTEDKVEAIRNAPTPQDATELRSWLGMLNFHAKFIPNLSSVIHPLNNLLGNKAWQWTKECDVAFKKAKEAISSDRLLAYYDDSLPLLLAADASPYGIGAAIMQDHRDGSRRPIAYASRSLNKHEKGYGQLDKEALAIMFGLKRFRMYLYGRHFEILTDHKPLERILGPKTTIPVLATQRLQRWALLLTSFDYDIKFIPSKANVLADALSRLPLLKTTQSGDGISTIEDKLLDNLPVTSKEIKHATQTDPVLSKVLGFVKNGWPSDVEDLRLKPYFGRRQELSVQQDCLMLGPRVVIPNKHQQSIVSELHISHPGIVRMKEVARSFVWWPGMDQEIEQLVRQCSTCQKVRNVPAVAPLMPWIWPSKPWTRVHADFAEKHGRNYLIVVDAYSKWPEIFLMNKTSAQATITVLRSLFSRYGLPLQLVTDNGPQFRSEEFDHFLNANGVKHVRVAPYHAASNGAAERMVQSFKRSLQASKENADIQQSVSRFLLAYRSTKHATTGCTPAKLFLGHELRTRLSLVCPKVEDNVVNKQSDQKMYHDGQIPLREFYAGEQVQVKDVRKDNQWWSATVAERRAPKSYIVILEDGRVWKRHVDHLRRAGGTVQTNPEQSSTPREVQSDKEGAGGSEESETQNGESDGGSEGTGTQSDEVSGFPATAGLQEPSQGTLRRSTRVRKPPTRFEEEAKE